MSPVADCATISRMFGAASLSSSGTSGASSNAWVRRSSAVGAAIMTDRSVTVVALMGPASGKYCREDGGFEALQRGAVAVHLGAQNRALERVDQKPRQHLRVQSDPQFTHGLGLTNAARQHLRPGGADSSQSASD